MVLDPIEKSMTDGATAIFREKIISRGVAGAGFGLSALATVATIGATQTGEIGVVGAVIGGAVAVVLGLYGIAFSVVRTIVTREAIHVRQGGRGRVIPLSTVTSTELYSYRAAAPVAVVVNWNESGVERRFAIPSADPKALQTAIDNARAPARVGAAATESAQDAVVEDVVSAEEEAQKPAHRAG